MNPPITPWGSFARRVDYVFDPQLCDGRGPPLVVLIGLVDAHDSPMFDPLMGQLRVPRVGPGRPRTRPAAVLGDKAYSSRAHRARLRARVSARSSPNSPPSRSPPTPQQRRSPGRLGCPEIQAPQRHRTILQHRQELARPGHPLRQARPHLPCRSSPRRHLRMATTFKRHALVAWLRRSIWDHGYVRIQVARARSSESHSQGVIEIVKKSSITCKRTPTQDATRKTGTTPRRPDLTTISRITVAQRLHRVLQRPRPRRVPEH